LKTVRSDNEKTLKKIEEDEESSEDEYAVKYKSYVDKLDIKAKKSQQIIQLATIN